MGYVVGQFPEEKQVLASSTADASSIEEGLSALLGVPALKRIGADGVAQKNGSRWPTAIPEDCRSTSSAGGSTVASVRRAFGDGGGGDRIAAAPAAPPVKPLPAHGRPGQQAVVAVASAKERLLQETRAALRVSTARLSASKAKAIAGSTGSLSPPRPRFGAGGAIATRALAFGGTIAAAPSRGRAASTGGGSEIGSKRHSAGRSPPSYSSVSRGEFGHTAPAAPSSEPGGNSSRGGRQRGWGVSTGGGGGSGGGSREKENSKLMSAAGAHDDDCASTLDLLSPGAFKGGVVARAAALLNRQRSTDSAAESQVPASGGGGGGSGNPPGASSSARSLQGQGQGPAAAAPQQVQIQVQPQQQPQQQQQRAVALPAAARALMAEFGIPPVLVAAMEADGITVPTPLQAAVWTAGRGNFMADLLVHVRSVHCSPRCVPPLRTACPCVYACVVVVLVVLLKWLAVAVDAWWFCCAILFVLGPRI